MRIRSIFVLCVFSSYLPYHASGVNLAYDLVRRNGAATPAAIKGVYMEALNSLSNFLKKSIEYPASRCRLPIQDGVKIKIHLLWQLNDTFGGHWTKYGDPLIKKYDETDFQKSPTMDKAEKILVTTEECLQNIRSS